MQEAGAGLLESAKRLLCTLTSIVSTRLELLANELQEERLRLTQMLFFALAAFFCFGMGVMLLTVFIVVLFWETHRLAVVGGLCAVFFSSGILMALLLRSRVRAKPRLFSASLGELVRDRAQLETGHE
jgi:uncharacterized membrane protein YqjE